MKRWMSILLGLMMTISLCLSGCGGGSKAMPEKTVDPNVGLYRAYSVMGMTMEELTELMGEEAVKEIVEGMIIELKEDGKCVFSFSGDDPGEGFWKMDGDKIIISEKENPGAGDETMEGTLADGFLTLEEGGEAMIFKKDGVEGSAPAAPEKPAEAGSKAVEEVESAAAEIESEVAAAEESVAEEVKDAEEKVKAFSAAGKKGAKDAAGAAAGSAEKSGGDGKDSAAEGDVGKYMIYEYEAQGQKVSHSMLQTAGMGDTYLELKPGGEAELYLFNQAVDATWKPGIVTVYGTTNYTYEIEGDTLYLDMAGVKYTMVKDGSAPAAGSTKTASETTAAAADSSDAGGSLAGVYYLSSFMGMDLKTFAEIMETTENEAAKSMMIEVKDDGTAVFTTDGEGGEVAFDVDGEKVTMTAGEDVLEGTIKNGVITFELEGIEIALTKDGAAAVSTGSTESAPAETSAAAGAAETTAAAQGAPADAGGGDGVISDEAVKKGYVYFDKILNSKTFDMTYEDLVEYFGAEGKFDKEEYSDHMKANYRYYKWLSDADPNTFIYVNLKQDEDGVYRVSSYNSSGFTGSQAADQYLEELQAEEKEKSKAAAASMKFRDVTLEAYPFGDSGNPRTVQVSIPESEWIEESRSGTIKIYNCDDLDKTFGVGFIQIKADDKLEDFDFYKDKFENYKDIEPRTIGGIEMQGRTYKNIGYDWIEYIGKLDDETSYSVGIVRVDVEEGTVGDKILSSITFK